MICSARCIATSTLNVFPCISSHTGQIRSSSTSFTTYVLIPRVYASSRNPNAFIRDVCREENVLMYRWPLPHIRNCMSITRGVSYLSLTPMMFWTSNGATAGFWAPAVSSYT